MELTARCTSSAPPPTHPCTLKTQAADKRAAEEAEAAARLAAEARAQYEKEEAARGAAKEALKAFLLKRGGAAGGGGAVKGVRHGLAGWAGTSCAGGAGLRAVRPPHGPRTRNTAPCPTHAPLAQQRGVQGDEGGGEAQGVGV